MLPKRCGRRWRPHGGRQHRQSQPPGADPEADLRAQPPASTSISTPLCTRPRTPSCRSHTSRTHYGTRSRSRRASTPRSSTPATSWARRSSGCGSGPRRRPRADHRLLGRPRTAGDADPARPDADDRRRLRPRRIDLRRPRARARSRGDPHPRRDGPDGGRCRRRAARPVVRDRPDPGGRLELDRLIDRGEIPLLPLYLDSPMASKASDIYRHHPEYYDEETASCCAGRDAARLPEPDDHQRRKASQAIEQRRGHT